MRILPVVKAQATRLLMTHVVAGLPVHRAGRSEQKTTNADLPRHLGEAHAGPVVDLVGEVRVEIAQRIIRQRREVDDRVEALQVGLLDVAHVLAQVRNVNRRVAVRAKAVQIRVDAGDVKSFSDEDRDHNRPDEPKMPRYEDFHSFCLPFFVLAVFGSCDNILAGEAVEG
jgi:hypothetical protein